MDMYSLMGMVTRVAANFWPFCNKDISSGVSSFLGQAVYPLVLDTSGSRGGDSSVESVGYL